MSGIPPAARPFFLPMACFGTLGRGADRLGSDRHGAGPDADSPAARSEILFRGAIQCWLGMCATALLFILAHGYIKPGDWGLSLFGTALTVAMIPLGFMADAWGLAGPTLAHTVGPVVLFGALSRCAASSSG